jgi:hypothetical protein
MGRFWHIFFASFCLIRKVLCDGCAAKSKANKKTCQGDIETMAAQDMNLLGDVDLRELLAGAWAGQGSARVPAEPDGRI